MKKSLLGLGFTVFSFAITAFSETDKGAVRYTGDNAKALWTALDSVGAKLATSATFHLDFLQVQDFKFDGEEKVSFKDINQKSELKSKQGALAKLSGKAVGDVLKLFPEAVVSPYVVSLITCSSRSKTPVCDVVINVED